MVIITITILVAVGVRSLVYYRDASIVARNVENVERLANATERFMLSGYSFTSIIPGPLNDVPVESLVAQLVAAGFFYPNSKITSQEILVRFYPDNASHDGANDSTRAVNNGSPDSADYGVLYFFPTKRD
jgi:hypothetical protein